MHALAQPHTDEISPRQPSWRGALAVLLAVLGCTAAAAAVLAMPALLLSGMALAPRVAIPL